MTGGMHSRTQSCDPLGQDHGPRALAGANFAVRESRTSGQLRSRKVYRESEGHIFHEALNFGLPLLGAGDLQLKEKQYVVCGY